MVSGNDYETAVSLTAKCGETEIEVQTPIVPGRTRTESAYKSEMTAAGFVVDKFIEMDISRQIPYLATIYVHKPLQ